VDMNLVPVQLPTAGLKGIGILPATSLEIAQMQNTKQMYEQYGLKPGDVLTAVDGEKIEQFWQFSEKLRNNFEPAVMLTFKRAGETKSVEKEFALDFSPVLKYKGHEEFILADIYGLIPRLKIISVETPEANEVLQKGDVILKVGDVTNPTYKQLRDTTTANVGKAMGMAVLRDNKIEEVNVTPKMEGDRAVIGIGVGLDVESTFAAATTDANTYPWPASMPDGAEITAVGGVKVKNYFDIASQLAANKGKTVKIEYSSVLNDKKIEFAMPAEAKLQAREQISQELPFDMLKRLYRAAGPGEALEMGSRKTLEFVVQTYMTLKGLIVRDISPKSLMGPVGMIAASSKIIAEREFIQYLHFL
jgi:membrane-associated protease RseP (regulator of RpoE activity)